ncbi:sugar-binding protein [Klebsiella pneumoniae]|uniref:Sugar-binding protein n=1 Tax=Klebsiella pneumoniae TaxID=573 RepID=A0A377XB30_KLEPN|nr:sugar-binding protein [Klebsiella pneumoniae]
MGGNGRHQVTLKALEEFHKQNPDINVKAEYTGWDGHLSRLTTQIAGGTEPNVMQTNWNWLPIFSKNGDGFYDLNTLKDEIDLSQFDAKELQSTTVNGKLNGIPISVTARVFYFKRRSMEKGGASPSRKPRMNSWRREKLSKASSGNSTTRWCSNTRTCWALLNSLYGAKIQSAGHR